jgi:hypothetical protein
MSSGEPVDWIAPEFMTLSIEPSWTPRPICDGFVPPIAAVGAPPSRWSWDSMSLKLVRSAL